MLGYGLRVTGYELHATIFAKVGIIIKTCARFALIAGAFLKPFAAGAVYGLEQMIGLEVGGNRFSFGLLPGETERVRAFAGTCFPVRAGVFSRFRADVLLPTVMGRTTHNCESYDPQLWVV